MKCENPIALKLKGKKIDELTGLVTDSYHLVNLRNSLRRYKNDTLLEYDVYAPCRKCYNCLRNRALEWFLRIDLERREHAYNCVVTLTYKDTDGELHYSDFQSFMRRLRRFTGQPVRFFVSGELGSKNKRPHWHAILFGYMPFDIKPFGKYFTSKSLAKVWQNGIVQVDRLNSKSVQYVVGYVMDKLFIDDVVIQRMSLKPAIGDIHLLKDLKKSTYFVNGKIYNMPHRQMALLKRYDFEFYSDIRDKIKEDLELVTPALLYINALDCAEKKKDYELKNLLKKR